MNAEKTYFGATRLHDILKSYPFYAGVVDSFTELPKTNANVNASFTIGAQRWVIKRYPGSYLTESLKLSHWFQQQLQSTAIPAATLVTTNTDRTYVTCDNACYSIHTWVTGKQIDYAKDDIPSAVVESLARNLARLHQAGKEIYSQQPAPRRRQNLLHWPLQYVARIRRATHWRLPRLLWLRLKPVKTAQDRWVLDTFARLEPMAKQIGGFSGQGFSEVCYVHNDIYWGNLIFGPEDELRAFIDFDKLEVGSWLYEVGSAAALCATSVVNIRDFIGAYEDEAGISLDIDLMVLAMMTKTVRSSLWCVLAHLQGTAADPAWLRAWSLHLEICLQTIEAFAQAK